MRFVAATPGNPHGANIELKLIDPSANPYLARRVLLGSALRGIDKGLRAATEECPRIRPRRRTAATRRPISRR